MCGILKGTRITKGELPMRVNYIYDTAQMILNKTKETDPFEIARSRGVYIRYEEFTNLMGMYTVQKNIRFIIINSRLPYLWQRIVCAHELGHDTFHRDLAKSVALQEFAVIDLKSRPEYEANMFAAELLLRDDDILHFLKDKCTLSQMAYELGIDENFIILKMQNMENRGYDIHCGMEPKYNILGNVNVSFDDFEYKLI